MPTNLYGRAGTIFIAASNATAASKGAADVTCTGTQSAGGDDATIQTWIHTLTTSGPGTGKVVLSEGSFYCSAPIYLDVSGITLEGQGPEATSLATATGLTTPSGAARIIIGSNGAFDGVDYATYSDSAPMGSPGYVVVRGLNFYDYTGTWDPISMTGYPRTDSATVTSGSTSVTDSSAVAGDLHQTITGPGIPPGTVITAVNTTTHVYTISNAATASGSSVVVGLSVPGSSCGLINRGNGTLISDVNVSTTALDGLSYQGFRLMNQTPNPGVGAGWSGSPGTIAAATASQGTFTVTITSGPSNTYTPFLAVITPPTGTDYDPEIVCVPFGGVSGSTWTVERGYMNTTAKAHASGSAITVMTVDVTSNAVTRDCYLYSPLRSGIMTQSGLNGGVQDSEWFSFIIQGGPTGSQYTENGIWTGGSGLRFIDCHPYFCSNDGLYAFSDTPDGNGGVIQYPAIDIVAGEYETNGVAGIAAEDCGGVTITGGVSMYANTEYDINLNATGNFRISDNWMSSGGVYQHINLYECQQGSIHDNDISGALYTAANTGSIQITGPGPGTNLEITVHDNLIQASGGTDDSIVLASAAGVNVHDNTCETSILESGTSDFNIIHNNTLVNLIAANPPVTVTGAHTRSYGNIGTADYSYINSSVTLPAADRNYWLDSSSSALTILPPGANFGGTACTGGDSAGSTTVHMSAYPSSWPQSGFAYIPVSGGTTGYERVSYQSIDSSGNLQGCTGVTSATVSGTAYLCPDPSMRFQFFLLSSLHSVTIDVPDGMTVNGLTTAFMSSTANHLYNAWLNATAGDWFIF
jgi:hypothetical protein